MLTTPPLLPVYKPIFRKPIFRHRSHDNRVESQCLHPAISGPEAVSGGLPASLRLEGTSRHEMSICSPFQLVAKREGVRFVDFGSARAGDTRPTNRGPTTTNADMRSECASAPSSSWNVRGTA